MTVTLLGTKGGTGTTTMTVNVGAELRRSPVGPRCWWMSRLRRETWRSTLACGRAIH
jgi:hypothetical protein